MPIKVTNIIVRSPKASVRSDSFLDWIARHWLAWFTALTGMWVTLPWLAPMLIHGLSHVVDDTLLLGMLPETPRSTAVPSTTRTRTSSAAPGPGREVLQ